MSKSTAVAAKAPATSTALTLADMDLEAFANMGMEEMTAEDLSVPYLRILAQLSPQVNKRDGAYVQGAEAGMIYNTVSSEVFDGEKGVLVVPCYFNRRLVEWKPRASGGGLVASYDGNHPIKDTTQKNDRYEDVLPNGNILSDTAQFFVLLLHPTQGPQRCLITMTSTQLKKAKTWNTTLKSMQAMGKNGMYTLPAFANVFRLRSVEERNDKGSWFGWSISHERFVDYEGTEKFLLGMGREFSMSVRAGDVKVKDDHEDTSSRSVDASDDIM